MWGVVLAMAILSESTQSQEVGQVLGAFPGRLIYVWYQGESTPSTDRHVEIVKDGDITGLDVQYPNGVE